MRPGPVSLHRHGPLAVVTIDNPPVNAASQAVRSGLLEAFATIAADAAIAGVILTCAGRSFVAGADIAEFGHAPVPPPLRTCCAAIEALPKPVLAILHGTALGGGLELALSCHFRVIDPAGAVALPEVSLGLIPGAGGTQRLPRLIGVAPALSMITSGRRVAAAEALTIGLVDAITQRDRLSFGFDFLLAQIGRTIPRLSARPFPAAEAGLFAEARLQIAKAARGQVAPARAIDVLEASAGLAFEAGLALEQEAFAALRAGPQAKALTALFFAERAIGKLSGLERPRPLGRIGVVGGGTMGAGIAAACLMAGLPVILVERDAAALEAGRGRIDAIITEAARRGKLPAGRDAAALSRLFLASTALAALAAANLVIEAVYESMEVKRGVFAALDAVLKPGAVLATNTSYLDVAALAAVTSRPQDVIGLHFFSPAHIMKLLEVVVPEGASDEAVATGFALGRALGKLAVPVGNAEGFIGNRILSAYRRAADHMVEDGASPFEIDAAFRDFGFPMGLFEMQDMAGLDIGWATRKRLAPLRPREERYVSISDRICERGWFGRKTGRGYYVYDEGPPAPNPEVAAIVAEERRAKGIVPRAFPAEAIQARVLLAMVNEGAEILGEGVALRASDIDVVMVHGYGFPRWRGGPMFMAQERGLDAVLADIRALEGQDPLWRPAETLVRGAEQGKGFGTP